MDFALSKQDSMALKGVAICAMLAHHLFCSTSFDVSQFSSVTLFLGRIGKVCVAIFLFLSGYGVAASYNNLLQRNKIVETIVVWIKAIVKRFAHFYLQYWPVFIIFVPIGVLVFGISLSSRYGESSSNALMLIGDVLGINEYKSYNITWWFNRLILVLYLLSPFLFLGIRNKWTCLPILIVLFYLSLHSYKIHVNCDGLTLYAISFGIGMAWSCHNGVLNACFSKIPRWMILSLSIVGIVCSCILREKGYFGFRGQKADLLLTLSLVVFALSLRQYEFVRKPLSFLGKHSTNIYLTHTFICSYWFMPFVFCSQIAPIIFVTLLTVCIILSLCLEWIKDKAGLYKLQRKIDNYLS